MLSKNAIITIGSKFIILFANFLTVVITTQILGSEGRGETALIIANISLITILNSILCGSTIAFHTPKQPRDFLLAASLAGAIAFSLLGSLGFSLLFSFRYFQPLFAISMLISLTNSISMYWLGKNDLYRYNLLTLINPLLILIFLAFIFFVLRIRTIEGCLYAYVWGLGTALIIGIAGLAGKQKIQMPRFDLSGFKEIVIYGFNNELNYFIQFLNYRLAYFFIARFLGMGQLGVFSIVVSISEAVWVISKSMSAVNYSNVINSNDRLSSHRATVVFSRQSFWISLLFLGFGILMPKSVYVFVFGAEFGNVKIFILYLIPGVIAIAVSNLYGHYFSAIGKLEILRNKSLIGLGVTLVLLPWVISKYQLTGVCITLNFSYILSALYLYYRFIMEKKSLIPEQSDSE
jgi:O-antigen/teichoic acid export membrane protein